MASAVFDHAVEHMGKAEMNWTTAQVINWCALGASGFGAAVNKNTWSHYSDVTNQMTGTNYTAGGNQLVVITPATASNVCTFDADDTSWANGTFTAYYGITHAGAARDTSTGALWSYHDLSGGQTVTAGTLTLKWATTGVFSATITAAA